MHFGAYTKSAFLCTTFYVNTSTGERIKKVISLFSEENFIAVSLTVIGFQ